MRLLAPEFVQSGDGPAVLLLHGVLGGYDQGAQLGLAAVGREGFYRIAVSRPGYLGTPLATGRTPEQQADLCADLLDLLKIPHAAIVAISTGGQCALQFALRHPDRCRALVMISACSGPVGNRFPFSFQLLMGAARFPLLTAALRKSIASHPENAARWLIRDPGLCANTLQHPEAGPILRDLLLSSFDALPQRLPGTRNDIVQSRLPFTCPVERINAPALVVHGTEDPTVPFAQAKALASRMPQAELLAIEGGGHLSVCTHLDLIRSRVRQFLHIH